MDARERFDSLAAALSSRPGVTVPGSGSGFGAGTLRFGGRIVALLSDDRLVVKLPADRVDELVADGLGHRYDGKKGRPMREWFALDADSRLAWSDLAEEALAFAQQRS